MRTRSRSDDTLLRSDFGAFYDRHLAAVAAFVGHRVRDPEVAFDLVAETFARALQHRMQFDDARGPAAAWLIGIARNLLYDSTRRGRVEASARQALGMAPVQLDDEALERVAELSRTELAAALAELPPDQREAVLRRVVLDEPYDELAGRLGCSEQVVRKRVSRGLSHLRSTLEPREDR